MYMCWRDVLFFKRKKLYKHMWILNSFYVKDKNSFQILMCRLINELPISLCFCYKLEILLFVHDLWFGCQKNNSLYGKKFTFVEQSRLGTSYHFLNNLKRTWISYIKYVNAIKFWGFFFEKYSSVYKCYLFCRFPIFYGHFYYFLQ